MIGRKPRTTPELPSEAPAIGTQIIVDGLAWTVRPLGTNVVILHEGKESDRAIIIDAINRTVLIDTNAGWEGVGRALECVELIMRNGETHEGQRIDTSGEQRPAPAERPGVGKKGGAK